MEGWIKLYRKVLENPMVMKDADHLAIWTYLMLKASHAETDALFKGAKTKLLPGQLITGSISIGDALKINESKVRRVLADFITDGQITKEASNKASLITIVNWNEYQAIDCPSGEGQPTDSRRTSDGQVTDNRRTSDDKQEYKKEKNERMKEEDKGTCQQVVDLFHRLCPSFPRVRTLSEFRKREIRNRMKSYTMADFETMFRNAEDSGFLKGENNRGWKASFDWLVTDKNMAKVIDGVYADKRKKEQSGGRQLDADELAAIERLLAEED